MRDSYIQTRTLETGKFPMLELVATRAIGHRHAPAGRRGRSRHHTVDFATFGMTKPSLARLLSVDDKIHLEIEFRCTRSAQ